jgi:hypothetical protein
MLSYTLTPVPHVDRRIDETLRSILRRWQGMEQLLGEAFGEFPD